MCSCIHVQSSNVVLCDDFEDGTLEAEIESTGEIMVPMKALNIIWGNDSRFWRFKNLPDDEYMADAFGWHSVPIKFKLRLTTKSAKTDHNYNNNTIIEHEDERSINLEPYREKQEVWHEISGGQFSVSNPDGFLEFGMFEVDTAWWKGNLVLAGVKIKPIQP